MTVLGCHSPYLPLWYVDDHGAHLIGWRGGWHCGDLTGQRSSPKSYSLLSGCYEDTGSMSCEKPRWTFSLASVLGRAWAAACPGLAVSAERARRVAQQRLTVEPGACGQRWLSSRGVAEWRGLSFGSECSLQPRAAQALCSGSCLLRKAGSQGGADPARSPALPSCPGLQPPHSWLASLWASPVPLALFPSGWLLHIIVILHLCIFSCCLKSFLVSEPGRMNGLNDNSVSAPSPLCHSHV